MERDSDSILLKIHRQYGKDESVAHLITEVKKLKFKIGELKSENQELLFANNQLQKDKAKLDAELKKPIQKNRVVEVISTRIEKSWKKEDYIASLLAQIKKHSQDVKNDREKFKNKYYDLLAKYNKLNINQ